MPPITVEPVRGVAELNRAFALAGADVRKEIKTRLRFYAQPVAEDAALLGVAIGAGAEWSQTRTGATSRMGYVAPVQRGTPIPARKRPQFARRLLTRAYIPALNKNRTAIGNKFDAFLARVTRNFGRGGRGI
jgi:hypothetical protein